MVLLSGGTQKHKQAPRENDLLTAAVMYLSRGASVVLTSNLSVPLGLCNGSRGVVIDILPIPGRPFHQFRRMRDVVNGDIDAPAPIVLVQFDQYRGHSFLRNIPRVVPICANTQRVKYGNSWYLRSQLPLKLAYATTFWKVRTMCWWCFGCTSQS